MMNNKFNASLHVGPAFEDLTQEEMMASQGGGPETVTTFTTFSSLPCLISATVGSVVVTVIYATIKYC